MPAILENKLVQGLLIGGAFVVGLAASTLAQAAPAHATLSSKHDGRWSIEVVTEAGACDRAYRYAVLVQNGEARYAGAEPITVSGKVAPSGSVKVSIAYGETRANVTGQLADASGTGRWTWTGSRTCSGHWRAERRG
ncbi:MAG TPA: hypothetical protein VIL65_06650 [Beijerinckiaceae bacterium]|jgi:hypothetical protein